MARIAVIGLTVVATRLSGAAGAGQQCIAPASARETSLLQAQFQAKLQAKLHASDTNKEPPYRCHSDIDLGPVMAAAQKGIAIDDSTLQWCTSQVPSLWPNAKSEVTSLRLFKAWSPDWDDWGRLPAWRGLRDSVKRNGAKVLIGTPVSCSEDYDNRSWSWTKELVGMLGPDHVMGLAIGNELELLQYKGDSASSECVRRIWDGGYFWQRFTQTVAEFDGMGFGSVPITSAFTGMAFAGSPFYEVPGKGLVKTFLRNATRAYGDRFVFTFNFYPYFDPNLHLDRNTSDQCTRALDHTSCWGTGCNVPVTLRMARAKISEVTGSWASTMWVGETGWSAPQSDTLQTRMKPCKAWSSKKTFQNFYKGFLAWDMGVGGGVPPPNHVFWFAMRDSKNFGKHEHFGLVKSCGEPRCKVHSEGYDVAHYELRQEDRQAFCADHPLYNAFSHNPRHCRNMCSREPRCKFYSLWRSNWCRLTERCSSSTPDGAHNISIYKKLEPAFAPADGGEGRACRGANAADDSSSYYRLILGTASLEDCKGHCVAAAGCAGVEYSGTQLRCEVWTRAGGIGATRPAAGYTCLRVLPLFSPVDGELMPSPTPVPTPSPAPTPAPTPAPATALSFAPADGGEGRACRGADAADDSNSYYQLIPGTASLDECIGYCEETASCTGVEYSGARLRCEVWTRASGIGATRPAAGYTCLRVLPLFSPVDGGANRACRGASSRDSDSGHYTVAQGPKSLEECTRECRETPGCVGVESHTDGRCEAWTRPEGIGASAPLGNSTCLRYEPEHP